MGIMFAPKRYYPAKNSTLAERLRARIEQPKIGCHEWQGSRNSKGYGTLKFNTRTLAAHRVAWEIAHGPIQGGLHVLHRCDNPPCCNPEHLYVGTNAENVGDREIRGRHGKRKLSDADVSAIRASTEMTMHLAARYGVAKMTIRRYRNHR